MRNFTCLFVFCFGVLSAIAQKKYDFEQEEKWSLKNQNHWEISSAKAFSGQNSLKYEVNSSSVFKPQAITSIDTEHTISKVRSIKIQGENCVIASSYEGTIMAVGYDGIIRWKNELSGFMNHDIWCEDITGDGEAEIFVANANGSIYCLDTLGKVKWSFKKNEAPMYSVCVVHKNNIPYVVCGGFDTNIYYLNTDGSLKQTLASSSYSVNTVFAGENAPNNTHIANVLRKIKKADGTEYLCVLATNNSMQVPGNVYVFNILGDLLAPSVKIDSRKPIGDLRIVDTDGDGNDELLLGSSTHLNDGMAVEIDPFNLSASQTRMDISTKKNIVGAPGYRVTQTEIIPDGTSYAYFILHGNNIILVPPSKDLEQAEFLKSKYAFNDMWKDSATGKIILAGDQSGGSAIHILDPTNPAWKSQYENFSPVGKIASILANTEKVTNTNASFIKPAWERNPIPVTLMHENSSGQNTSKYHTPIYLPQPFMPQVQDGETWNRAAMPNEKYRDKRDKRRQYVLSEQQVLDKIIPLIGADGITYWGGHGNDPYFYSKQTTKKVIDAAAGKQTVLIYPEFEDHGEDAEFVLNDLFYDLATYGKDKNLKLFIRSKNIFWLASVYISHWSRLASGEFSNVFVPSMEETTDKTMELSVSGRMGVWLSGIVNDWGTRAVQDNTSYDRLRQHSDQSLDNHFLRQLVYAASNGARFFDNHRKPKLFEELLASGAIFVPKREELVSLSPVHLSMFNPDEHFLEEGSKVKWLTKFDENFENNNPFVFSRMNGTWPAAPVTEWDFSNYAAGVKERKLNFLPSYPKGMVLITPPQKGIHADETAFRGKMETKLHPLYKNILKEYYTDGRHYYSENGTQYSADTYYKTIQNDLVESAKKIPLTVEGDVAWVVAQTAPKHLRLTLIDGGYINPKERKAMVKFHTVTPVKMTDLLDGKSFSRNGAKEVEIDVPCGMFRFIDIELAEEL
ncbi:PQQ-binding-like beta-propeller repeat protein [Flavicella sediminum]|uniref:WD40 repeat domain-containing protein n=1 Tax=Flavicella sediminum TaxID=2585141 RepID=UPI001121B03E|nr:WD40 repeat domain-containing protein [Flavicella sediminum]